MNAVRHWLKRRVGADREAGTTMVEMVVAMGLLSIFMAIFTTVMYLMTSDQTKVQNISDAVNQTNTAFLSLDRTMRYATAISNPLMSSSGTWHVEFDRPITDPTTNVTSERCTQLAIIGTQLRQRSWDPATYSASSAVPAWSTLSSYVTNGTAANGTADTPFVASTTSQVQRLTVTLVVRSGAVSSGTNRVSSTFPALNSTTTPPASVCQQISVDS